MKSITRITAFVRVCCRVIHRVAFGRERPLGELRDALFSLPHLSAEEAAAFGEDLEAARAELASIRMENRREF